MFLLIILLPCLVVICLHIWNRLSCGITQTPVCLAGKTALITGGNAGIGYQVSLILASRGCRVIIVDKNDPHESVKKIVKETQNCNVVSKIVDLTSFEEIRKFAQDLRQSEDKLDILINNAGIAIDLKKLVTEDGLNGVMQVNYFGHFLLTHLLIDLLKKSVSGGRIIFTSSALAYISRLTSENFVYCSTAEEPSMFNYCDSKLAMIVASDLFAQKLKSQGITSNSLHAGLVQTDIYRQIPNFMNRFLHKLNQDLFGKSVWLGAQTTVHVAVAKELQNVSGKYFSDCREYYKPWKTRDEQLCKKIWKQSEEFVKLLPSEKL